MTINYNVTGSERKRLADCIAAFLGCEKEYLGVPSCAYRAGHLEIGKDGAVSSDGAMDGALLEKLEEEGFHAEAADGPAKEQDAGMGLTVEVPLDKVSVGNLHEAAGRQGLPDQKGAGD